ncbi:tumor protein p53 inducible protein 3, putative [Acanthamoeba castellanii str. Neff]|uniref:Tumor protein p53 inducible protein 3, putative n=1 Tax=Acanthamoeba castellanii (strain ATCC 30010 / Neff) TaxID=1257118 RepID=L8H7J5_ACACF|nr:tumor protein p53 inducible protein 3, putative [Acanthamoeba castellanii str. Neff]ELR21499.1 tumor protein p53 inducible protein 3, putative [Acanthamoeba castellanii str. Neff]
MSSKATMRAVSVGEPGHGGPELLYVADDVPRPELKPAHLLVKIKATALNRADTVQRLGKYPPPPGESTVLGLEMAGVVEEVGEGVTSFKAGDRVCALLGGGGYAEYCVIHQDTAMHIPENLSFEEAAAIPEAFLTAYQALVWIGGLAANKRVLIHAGVIITASKDKLSFCHELGADETIDRNENEGKWVDKVLSLTGGKGVDVIIDFVGASYWEQNLAALAMDGTMVMLAFLSGSQIPSCDIAAILRKRLNIRGSTLRARSLDYKVKLTKLHDMGQEFEAFAMDKFKEGYMESNQSVGKIVLNGM